MHSQSKIIDEYGLKFKITPCVGAAIILDKPWNFRKVVELDTWDKADFRLEVLAGGPIESLAVNIDDLAKSPRQRPAA